MTITEKLNETLTENLDVLEAEYQASLAVAQAAYYAALVPIDTDFQARRAALLVRFEAQKPYDYTVAPAWGSNGTYRE